MPWPFDLPALVADRPEGLAPGDLAVMLARGLTAIGVADARAVEREVLGTTVHLEGAFRVSQPAPKARRWMLEVGEQAWDPAGGAPGWSEVLADDHALIETLDTLRLAGNRAANTWETTFGRVQVWVGGEGGMVSAHGEAFDAGLQARLRRSEAGAALRGGAGPTRDRALQRMLSDPSRIGRSPSWHSVDRLAMLLVAEAQARGWECVLEETRSTVAVEGADGLVRARTTTDLAVVFPGWQRFDLGLPRAMGAERLRTRRVSATNPADEPGARVRERELLQRSEAGLDPVLAQLTAWRMENGFGPPRPLRAAPRL